MLILSRKVNEKIVIGDEISVSVIEIRGDQVRLGVDAPKTVKVFREEVFDAIRTEN
ncbi:MAG: carbon storage regulator CsrA, partial [Treponema sp.]|nr:carbon storage regulator CsrA [Treponema sp.]